MPILEKASAGSQAPEEGTSWDGEAGGTIPALNRLGVIAER